MKFEELKKSKSYQKIMNIITIYAILFFVILIVLIVSIGTDVPTATFLVVLIAAAIFGAIFYYVKDILAIKKNAKSFEKCTGRVVNLTGSYGRDMTKFMIVFEDFMNVEHRMPSHGIFTVYEISEYMEKEIVIYYSKNYPKVLIANEPQSVESKAEETVEDDPFKL